jgi:hypothetical protein
MGIKMQNPSTRGRRTALTIILLALCLVGGIVWAAVSGVLTIGGTTTTSANTDVIFSSVTPVPASSSAPDNVAVEASISPDGHSLIFSADMAVPGQEATVNYVITNVGSTNARIYVPTFAFDESKVAFDVGAQDVKMQLISQIKSDHDFIQGRSMYLCDRIRGRVNGFLSKSSYSKDYIAMAPGGIINDTISFKWDSALTSLPVGEYQVEASINFEAVIY